MAIFVITISMSILLLLLSLIINTSNAASPSYNVLQFGAKPDGKTESTQPFLKAWVAACNSVKAATIYVPKGRYVIKAVEFRGPCKNKINVRIDGTLVAPSDFRALGDSDHWIVFVDVDRLSVLGGSFDAKGAGLWACRKSGQNCPTGARSITFNWANNVLVKGLTSVNSQGMHLVVNSCNNVRVQNVKIIAPGDSPNTDGIHVQSSNAVTITGAKINTGDDCISIGPGTRNLWMEKIQCGLGHGVSIGSLAREYKEEGVQNVTLINSSFKGSDNGVRIKSWARDSTGYVTNINYRNIVMRNVQNPILIDQNYCPNNQNCPAQSSGIKISRVTYQNIQGTSATQVAMKFDCSASNPCRGIKLQDIKLTYVDKTKAKSYCKNIGGTAGGVILPENCL